jgi:cysteine desulfurase
MERDIKWISYLSDRLKNGILSKIPRVLINGSEHQRYPGNLNISFAYVEGESLLMALKGIAISSVSSS